MPSSSLVEVEVEVGVGVEVGVEVEVGVRLGLGLGGRFWGWELQLLVSYCSRYMLATVSSLLLSHQKVYLMICKKY